MYANELEFGWCWLPFFMMKSLSSHIGKILKYSKLNIDSGCIGWASPTNQPIGWAIPTSGCASPTSVWSSVRSLEKRIRRRSDIQLLILCENRSNSIYFNARFFSAGHESDDLVTVFRGKLPRRKVSSALRQSPNPVWRCQSMQL